MLYVLNPVLCLTFAIVVITNSESFMNVVAVVTVIDVIPKSLNVV